MPAPTTEERFTRGRTVRHTMIPVGGGHNTGRVLGVVQGFYKQGTWVVIMWAGGVVGCVRPQYLELLREGKSADETPRG